jgi:glycosyltransferase involved in cell wall biosynthesis
MRVVMFVRNDLSADARVLKEGATLRDAGHQVTLIGALPADSSVERDRATRDGVDVLRVRLPRYRRWWRWVRAPWRLFERLGRRLRRSPVVLGPGRLDTLDWLATWWLGNLGWARAAARAAPVADVYHGHDLTGLPAAVEAARRNGGIVVYDSHELFLESGSFLGRPRWALRRIDRQERRWAARASALVTVNDALAERLGPKFGVPRVVVVHNCPPRPSGDRPESDRIRIAAGIPAGMPVVLHHGSFRAHRGLEVLADAFLLPELADAHLVYLGFGPLRDRLLARAADPRARGRIHVLDAVAPADVVEWVASADLEGLLFEPVPLNHYLATPNKLFESLAAGIPVVASDFPGIRHVLLDDPDGPLGAVCDPTDAAAIAAGIRSILDLPPEARAALRGRCHRAARDRWNWEMESAKLVALYAELERESAA